MSDVVVVVPVMRRPKNATKFMSSIRKATPEGVATVVAVCDDDDHETRRAWERRDATVLRAERGRTFPNKVQHAYLNTSESWILLVGDDVEFQLGWWDAAMAVADGHALISTNDCGNPYVTTGELAIHPIMRRTWVDESGGSWDGPGHIAHEGYTHGFVDWEWSTKARDEGMFVFASDCVVKHMHPVWQRGKWDSVYSEGIRRAARDSALFKQRHEESKGHD